MKTLEAGVEALQNEKTALVAERDELKSKVDAFEKNAAVLTEQVAYLNERNSTLSKKCVDLLDGSKDFRQKYFIFFLFHLFIYIAYNISISRAISYEDELNRIKPRYQEMEANIESLNEQNKLVFSFSFYENIFFRSAY